MDSEEDKNIAVIEQDNLNPEKELNCAKEEIKKESWLGVDGCLNKFLIKFQEQDNSKEEIKKFRKIFLEIKELLDVKKISEKGKYRIDSTIEQISRFLEI